MERAEYSSQLGCLSGGGEFRRRGLKLVQIIEQTLLLQRLLYLPGVNALFESSVRNEICGGERLAGDGASVGVLLQPLDDACVVE